MSKLVWWSTVCSALVVCGSLTRGALPASAEEPSGAIARTLAEAGWLLEPLYPTRSPLLALQAQAPAPAAQADTPYEVTARFGAGYQNSGGGYDGLGNLNWLAPFWQVPEQHLIFNQGRFNLDNGGLVGGTVLLGYRRYRADLDRSFGGYLSYDLRDTDLDPVMFHQLGLGFETLGPWDLRLNAYLPTGKRQGSLQLVGTPRFAGNRLLLPTGRDTSLGGFDFEGGTKILDFLQEGQVRAYLGGYYYDGPNTAGTLGGKVRLEVRPSRAVILNLGVQHDDRFGTNFLLSVGASWGRQYERPQPPTNLARFGDLVERAPTIVVSQERRDVIATNPATGQPWFFSHVLLGGGGADGSFASPFNTLQAALNSVPTDSNGIVYVQAGTNPGLPGFLVPNNVQVLSTGPLQFLDTREFGRQQLPLSGSGQFPLVNGAPVTTTPGGVQTLVAMGNNALLSGFDVRATGNNVVGIAADNVSNFTIRDNRVTTTGNNALGISIRASNNASLGNATVSGNAISTTGNTSDGIRVSVLGNSTLSNATVSGNQITTTGANAHGFYAQINGGTLGNATLSGNTLTTSGLFAEGLRIFMQGTSRLTSVTIANNQINSDGVGITLSALGNTTVSNAVISGNTVSTTGGNAHGLYLFTDLPANLCATVSGNTLITRDATANPLRFNEANGSTLRIVDTGPTFPTTQATNTLTALGGAVPFFPVTTGGLVSTASCP